MDNSLLNLVYLSLIKSVMRSVVKIFKRFFNCSKYTVSFVGNLSSVVMKFKLAIKKSTKVAVGCINLETLNFNCYCCDQVIL